MPNTNTKSTWTPNDTQKAFIEDLRNAPEGITLLELKLQGKEYKTGSINTLVSKGIVLADCERTFDCDIVYAGQVIGRVTKKGKVYRLASQDAE